MFAVIRTGGKQYQVSEGDTLDIELIGNAKDKAITISDVLMVTDGDNVKVGRPAVSGASVTLEIIDQVKAPKVVAFKYRRREGYHRTVGHRQKYNRVKVVKISA